MKVSILLRIHRYGGLDVLYDSLIHQTFPKNEYEVIICDKLYDYRKDLVKEKFECFNVIHFKPSKISEYYAQSAPLNDCLKRANGELSIIIGDYTYCNPKWIERHWNYHQNGYCTCAPQEIYGLPPLKDNLRNCWSTFKEDFNPIMFKTLPTFVLDPKLNIPHNIIVNHNFWYNRNESFPTQWAKDIGGWNEEYDKSTAFENKEFALRLFMEKGAVIVNNRENVVYRIMSFPIGPHFLFLNPEYDDNINRKKYEELCKKYEVVE